LFPATRAVKRFYKAVAKTQRCFLKQGRWAQRRLIPRGREMFYRNIISANWQNNKFMWQVYILKCADGKFYTGVTTDLKRRVSEHNNSKLGAKFTRSRRPVKLLYSIRRKDRASAQAEEIRIKRLPRIKKLALTKKLNSNK